MWLLICFFFHFHMLVIRPFLPLKKRYLTETNIYFLAETNWILELKSRTEITISVIDFGRHHLCLSDLNYYALDKKINYAINNIYILIKSDVILNTFTDVRNTLK